MNTTKACQNDIFLKTVDVNAVVIEHYSNSDSFPIKAKICDHKRSICWFGKHCIKLTLSFALIENESGHSLIKLDSVSIGIGLIVVNDYKVINENVITHILGFHFHLTIRIKEVFYEVPICIIIKKSYAAILRVLKARVNVSRSVLSNQPLFNEQTLVVKLKQSQLVYCQYN